MVARMRGRGADAGALASTAMRGLAALRRKDPEVRKAEGQRSKALARQGRDRLKQGMVHNIMQGKYFRHQVI